MDAFLPLILGGIFQGIGAGGANRALDQQTANQQKIEDYFLGKAQNVYDPIREQTILPALMSRAKNAPFYGKQALQEANALSQPMELNY
jgi:hypothetical protein